MITKKQLNSLNPNSAEFRIAKYLKSGRILTSLNCLDRVNLLSSSLHSRLSVLDSKGIKVRSHFVVSPNKRRYKIYYV